MVQILLHPLRVRGGRQEGQEIDEDFLVKFLHF